ncbi:hypothetical protein B0I35DRAFT_405916 [Stachybotrys elegans]|uniref:LIM zinc-binding domain-containing protein n=1 Tax=Stachybotrys elegans TaxID=80388 RepID=A0A8K0T0K0_9HYPO|nr:hypothetical protein B0I35DRAFT_405916 [Stachybotrys elegans]
MRAMGRPSEGKTRKVTPPSPSYMTNDQFAKYLADLRSNRVARPGGPRPPPPSTSTIGSQSHTPPPIRTATSKYSLDNASQASQPSQVDPRRYSHAPSPTPGSISSRYSTASFRGRDYYPSSPSKPLSPSEVVPSATYMERGHRWMEKEEAHSLRDAMDEMHLRQEPEAKAPSPASDEDESRIYNAALDEAAELVWQHQHGGPAPNPDAPYRYKPHLRKDSYAHARTASVGKHGRDIAASGLARDSGSRSVSGSSTDSDGMSRRSRTSLESKRTVEEPKRPQKGYGSVGARPAPSSSEARRRSSMKRNISGEIERPFSGDQIWEEPETASVNDASNSSRAVAPETLSSRTQNPVNRARVDPPGDASALAKRLERVEIHRNPPTRSRNPQYTVNTGASAQALSDDKVERKNGVEIRAQDIREATSMRLKDRSSKLPEPTAVSDNPGRPIVSFDANWKAPDETTDRTPDRFATDQRPRPSSAKPDIEPMVIPSIVVAEDSSSRSRPSSRTDIPSVCVSEADGAARGPLPTINVPTIAVDDAPDNSSGGVPIIVTPDSQPARSARPLPTPGARGGRAQRPRGHWSPAPGAVGRATALCHECGFPIEGRFVALRGATERFHPQCFSCFTCGTSLEAMEISSEPQHMRDQRLERIRRREAGEILEEKPGMTAVEDGDDRLRFFCHLDWHELFAPRCKHCKTPIIGEHVVALGEHWHYGHFFCAECGDPFEQGMTHIEKDGYAWCINCQTKRTERRAPKCRRCKTAVIGEYIQALGGEWHEHCFRCAECQGSFEDGQIFPKEVAGGIVVLCTPCRAKELKL